MKTSRDTRNDNAGGVGSGPEVVLDIETSEEADSIPQVELDAETFYDLFGARYYLFSKDWRADVELEGEYYSELCRSLGASMILDCSCGPGTQAIGMATRGFSVTATDISRSMVRETKRNASAFGAALNVKQADMRSLPAEFEQRFDVVMAVGNAVPHLDSKVDVNRAIVEMAAAAKPGGSVVIGIRDYDQILKERPRFDFRRISESRNERNILYDLWDYDDDEVSLLLHLFIMKEKGATWRSVQLATRILIITDEQLRSAMVSNGCRNIRKLEHRWGFVYVGEVSNLNNIKRFESD